MLRLTLLVLIASTLTACFPRGAPQFLKGELVRKTRYSVKPETEDAVSWKLVSEKVFAPRCTTCHGTDGNVNLESYEEARRHAADIELAVFTRQTMPPRGKTLTAEQYEILGAWMNVGMRHDPRKPAPTPAPKPEEPTPTPTPPPSTPTQPGPVEPPPTPVPGPQLEPTFESILKLVVKPKCIECHNVNGEADLLPMETLEEWLDPANRIVVPGDIEKSNFIRSIRPDAKRLMPPKKSGLAAVKPEEIEIISQWILNGAKD